MKTLIALIAVVGVASATEGFDASQAVTKANFKCMYDHGYRFFLARVYRSNGAVDNIGIQNIKNANAAGWTLTDGYIFPCATGSSIACKSAKQQVQDAINAMKRAGAKFGMVWIDVEIYNWGSNFNANRQFILDAVNQVKANGIRPGIYSNKNNWASIVGVNWSGVSDLDLWWAAYNGDEGFSKFVPFGGWKKPAIHQYAGDSTGTCGISIDKNYY